MPSAERRRRPASAFARHAYAPQGRRTGSDLPAYTAGSTVLDAPEYGSHARISVVHGGVDSSQQVVSPVFSAGVRFLIAVCVLLAVLGVLRVSLEAATAKVTGDSSSLTAQIEAGQVDGASLEVARGALDDTERLIEEGEALHMSDSSSSESLTIALDPVAVDDQGNLSLAESIRRASGLSNG